MRDLETHGKRKAYELELLLARVVKRELDNSGLTLKEFSKVKGISYGDLKHAILCNLTDFNAGNSLKFIAETFHKLSYELKFILVDGLLMEEPPS